jgi:peptide deformylase
MFDIQTGDKNPILRTVTKLVSIFDDKLEILVEEMIETMTAPDKKTGVRGVGLAANQVGIDARILLLTLNVSTKKEHKIVPMINPEVRERSKHEIWMEEGCLSVPDVFFKVKRATKVKVRWQNLAGNWCERKFDKWDARIFLHELDHLDGKLFTDYLKDGEYHKVKEAREKHLV